MLTDQTGTLHGSRFHYTEQGERSAPPVVMLHGVTGHARTWDEEGAALAPRHRVLALDQRGHGDSDPPPDADYTIASLPATSPRSRTRSGSRPSRSSRCRSAGASPSSTRGRIRRA